MNSPTEKIRSLLVYSGKGTAILQLSGKELLDIVDLENVEELIDQGIIVGIQFNGIQIRFHHLLIIVIKYVGENRNEFDNRLLFGLLERNIVELSYLVFGDDPLPERLFPLGRGIYEIEKGVYFDSQSSTPFFSRFDELSPFAQRKYQLLYEVYADRTLGEKRLSNPRKWGYEYDFPKFNINEFLNYLENWIKGKRFHFEGERLVISPLFG